MRLNREASVAERRCHGTDSSFIGERDVPAEPTREWMRLRRMGLHIAAVAAPDLAELHEWFAGALTEADASRGRVTGAVIGASG